MDMDMDMDMDVDMDMCMYYGSTENLVSEPDVRMYARLSGAPPMHPPPSTTGAAAAHTPFPLRRRGAQWHLNHPAPQRMRTRGSSCDNN